MKYTFLILLSIITLVGCKSELKSDDEIDNSKKSEELKELLNIMQGLYTTEKQSKTDKAFYDISLRMTPIWETKGHYLYVEQTITNKPNKPYRIRIYRIFQRKQNEFINEIYTLKDEKKWIGKWKTPKYFDTLTEDEIEEKNGCEIIITRTGEYTFEGTTKKKYCLSEIKGASYATSTLNLSENKIVSWDQGFDKKGNQVWGSKKGGYEFIKTSKKKLY